MRPLKALFLGCTVVTLLTSVWLITSVYSNYEADGSLWRNLSDWSDSLLAPSPATPVPDDILRITDPDYDEEEEEVDGEEDGVEEAKGQEDLPGNNNNEPEDSESKLKKQKMIVAVAQRALEKYEVRHKTVHAMLDDFAKEKRRPPQKLIDREKRLQEAIEKKKDEVDKGYIALRNEMLLVEYESLRNVIVVPDSEIGPDGIQPKGDKILILTAFDNGGSASQANISTSLMMNRKEYCDYHGYTHYFVNTTRYEADDEFSRPPAWWKVPAIQEAFTKYPEVEWIWWMDADMIITNQLLDLAEHVLHPYVLSRLLTYGKPINDLGDRFTGQMYPTQDEVNVANIDVIFAQDGLGINAGSFMIHRSPYTEVILDLWQNPIFVTHGFFRAEQDAYVYMYQNDPVVRAHTGFVPQRKLNAYTGYAVADADWHPGDLAIHFAGKNKGEDHIKSWHEHFAQIVRVPEEYRLY